MLDEQIGGTVDGYTWHHTEIPGKMQLVPTGIHNITTWSLGILIDHASEILALNFDK